MTTIEPLYKDVHKDIRLVSVDKKMKEAEQKAIDADFEGKERLAQVYREEYKYFKDLHDQGIRYEPTF